MSSNNPSESDHPERPDATVAGATNGDDRAARGQGGEKPGDGTAGAQSSGESAGAAEGSNEYEALRNDLEQMKDRTLRVQAELENYRKRVAREMADERRYAEMSLMRDLLPVMDNMQRAIDAAGKSGESPQLLEGFRMVVQQLDGILHRHHCEVIEALHEPFDPNLHEAILQQPSADYPPGTVLLVTQTGYRLHERVVRPAQVIVSSAPAGQHESGAREENQ